MPPSIRIILSFRTGVNTPGIAILARIAVASIPLWNTICSPFTIFCETQAKGMGSLLKSTESWYPTVSSVKRLARFCPFMMPPETASLGLLVNGNEKTYFSDFSRSLSDMALRFTRSLSKNIQSCLRTMLSNCWGVYPIEYNPPIMDPILVPTI